MKNQVAMPAAFDVRKEKDKFLSRVKKRAATNFAFTKATSMQAAADVGSPGTELEFAL